MGAWARRLSGGLAVVVAISCHDGSRGPTAPGASADSLLSAGRLAGLPAGERSSWRAYVDSSAARGARDRAFLDAEARGAGAAAWFPAPVGPDFALTASMTGSWFATAEARRIAGVIVSYQTPAGGWSKTVDMTARPRLPGEGYTSTSSWSWVGTFDNGGTTEELRFLGAESAAQLDPAAAGAFLAGLAYVLAAQFPNGCWPQVYPLAGSYHDAATFNDDMMLRVVRLLRSVAAGEYAQVPAPLRAQAGEAVGRGIACVLASQVREGSRLEVWGQQHDPLTLVPVAARAYEPAALTGGESAGLLDLLMEEPSPDAAVVASVKAGAAWFREKAMSGYTYTNGELVAQPGAGPLWARFYELGTGRPIFGDRDGSVHYDVREISLERRLGYAWYVTTAAGTLARYDAWAKAHP